MFKNGFFLAINCVLLTNFSCLLKSVRRQERRYLPTLIELEEDDVNLSLSEILSTAELPEDVLFVKGIEIKFFGDNRNLVLTGGRPVEGYRDRCVDFDSYLLYNKNQQINPIEAGRSILLPCGRYGTLQLDKFGFSSPQIRIYLDITCFQERILCGNLSEKLLTV